MTLRVVLTVFEIVLLIGTLAFFLNVVARQLNSISATLPRSPSACGRWRPSAW